MVGYFIAVNIAIASAMGAAGLGLGLEMWRASYSRVEKWCAAATVTLSASLILLSLLYGIALAVSALSK